ncbi:MAG: polyisoprenoid-binding protein [Xanthomonadales bacterium PRO7]|nr:polyisoprenoid-binding protein [Xanthomonadales bacterium PRO7]
MNVRSAILMAAILCATSAHASDYVLDPVHTQVFACASHIGFSTPCARFKIKSGFFHFDGDWNAATVDATIDTTSIDLGDAKWDSALRSWEFLESDKYPEAHFVSRSAEKAADNSGIVHGMLTLRGVTRNVDLHVTFNRTGLDPYDLRYTAGFSATAMLKRSDFGMRKYLPDIGDVVTIRIEAEGLRGKPAPVQTAPAKPES